MVLIAPLPLAHLFLLIAYAGQAPPLTLDAEGGREGRQCEPWRAWRKAGLSWGSTLTDSLGKGLTFSEPQFPGSGMEIKDPLVVQWLGLHTSTSRGTGQGTKIPHAA